MKTISSDAPNHSPIPPLQNRIYQSHNTTPAEILSISHRMFVFSPQIVLTHQVPQPSLYTLSLFQKRLKELTSENQRFVMIVNSAGTRKPDNEYRKALVKWLKILEGRLIHACVVTGGSRVLNASAKIILQIVGVQNATFLHTLDEAIEIAIDYRDADIHQNRKLA
ncbi:hypothetical protein [Pontibacter sp. G13]|uniref:hypothetical protein n=1 Tax=Pontibacter sp. G13 TaxID=3074898 RepID=UPI00288AED7F|nr:hypothetical protein [Pontibacter sp. G13]WNJ17258.1 hypothetical protein RJD25_20575 [Pontibacter sp. G13]